MSFIEPPTYTCLRKRKRPGPSSAGWSRRGPSTHLPADAINPHSHDQDTLLQIGVAGLTHADRLPGDDVADFPHRPLPDDWEEEETGRGGGGMGKTSGGKRRKMDSGETSDGGDDSPDTDGFQEDEYDDDDNNVDSGNDSDNANDDGVHKEIRRRARHDRKREARRRRFALRMLRAQDRHIGVLAAVVQRGLEEADHGMSAGAGATTTGSGTVGLARAKRAFGLLLRTDVKGKPVDLRQHYFWAMGAELLMREGEDRNPNRRGRQRWGLAANIPHVRAYYEDLIHQHPFHRMWPRSISALTFWPALVGTELYSAYAEERLAMQRLDEQEREEKERERRKHEEEEDNDEEDDRDQLDGQDDSFDSSLVKSEPGAPWEKGDDDEEELFEEESHHENDKDNGDAGVRRRELRRRRAHPRREAREDIRLETLTQLRDLARRMDAVMVNPPYSTSPEMRRLRATLALYMGDLALPTPPRTHREGAEGRRQRTAERARAQELLARLLQEQRDGGSSIDAKSRRAGITVDSVTDAYMADIVRRKRRRVQSDHNDGSDVDDGYDEDDEDEDEDDAAGAFPLQARPVFTSLPIRQPSL